MITETPVLTSEDIPLLIIYIVVFSISMFIYRKWKKRYINTSDKTTEATLLSTRSYDSHYGYAESRHAPYILGKYEFYINGKRHTTKFKFFSYLPQKHTLYYKKGAWDIRWDPHCFNIFYFWCSFHIRSDLQVCFSWLIHNKEKLIC